MPPEAQHGNALAIVIFLAFVGFTLGLSFWLGRKAKTAGGYFAAHGQVGWFVNGVAFAGDYLSAASFLGICGMIAFYGYDGFLYSIGFLAGWVVALFVIAEPIKKLGKYTFADALDAKFNSKGIKFAAAISTLVVSIFYLIPQMVGAGSLLKALLQLPAHDWRFLGMTFDLNHALGVVVVGGVVIMIVVTAGMVSTTWVQFIKGSLLVVFCAALVVGILNRGVRLAPGNEFQAVGERTPAGRTSPPVLAVNDSKSGPVGPVEFMQQFSEAEFSRFYRPTKAELEQAPLPAGTTVVRGKELLQGDQLLLPGGYFTGIRSDDLVKKLDFASLMLALFCGTASLPHILIRYYTVKDAAAARKSTVVGIIAIGFFYMLTLYIGLGAMVSGAMDPADSNMAAPLLARTFGNVPFALITAIAFTTVLGTVSGLILAAAGAVAHDLIESVMGHKLKDHAKVGAARWASVAVGFIAVVLGILAKDFNVGFLVGWAFNVAASANLPAIVMLLFWRGTTRQGMIASILAGTLTSVGWLMLTKEAFVNFYGIRDASGVMPFSQPGLVTIPLAFIVLVVVSLITRRSAADQGRYAAQFGRYGGGV
jgi:cation/acetate symporter